MILSNVEVHKALDEGRLIIRPQPTPRFPEIGRDCPYGTHSVDLCLSNEIVVPEGGTFVYDVTQPGNLADQIQKNSKSYQISKEQPFQLKSNKFVLGKTLEWIDLPILNSHDTCLAARIEGKSSRARLGLLVHFTAPTVHPGFCGHLTLEMINLGPVPIQLVPGMHIAQLIIEEIKGIPVENPSSFQGQTSAVGVASQTDGRT